MADSYLPTEFSGVGMEISSSYNLNDFTYPTILRCSTLPTNGPTGFLNSWFLVFVTGSAVLQIAIFNPGSSSAATPKKRQYINSAWSEWKDL